MSDIINDIMAALPPTILGVPTAAFLGLLVGVLVACYEGLGTKFQQYKVKVGDKSITFDKRYLASGVAAVVITFLTVYITLDGTTMNGVSTFGTAAGIGFTEGMVTIKALNRRIDLFIARSAEKAGLSEDAAKALADSVEVTDVTAQTSTEAVAKPAETTAAAKSADVEDITLKSM